MSKDIEKSRPYYYGKGQEFPTREEAMKQALYKRDCMLMEIEASTRVELDGEPEVVDVYDNALQVKIPIVWES